MIFLSIGFKNDSVPNGWYLWPFTINGISFMFSFSLTARLAQVKIIQK